MKSIQSHSKIIIITIFLIGFQTFLVYGQESPEVTASTEIKNGDKPESTVNKKTDNTKSKALNRTTNAKKSPVKSNKIPVQTTIFINGRVNPINLVITDHKNKSFYVNINTGRQFVYHNKYIPHHLHKVVCSGAYSSTVSLNKSDLDTYAVFLFNENKKTEKFHYISSQEETMALKVARDLYDHKRFGEVEQQSIYNP